MTPEEREAFIDEHRSLFLGALERRHSPEAMRRVEELALAIAQHIDANYKGERASSLVLALQIHVDAMLWGVIEDVGKGKK